MHALRGLVYYPGDTECLSKDFYTSGIQQGVHITSLYNTPVQHANKKLSGKEKLDLIEVIKGETYIWIVLGFSLYSLTKKTGRKEEITEKQI